MGFFISKAILISFLSPAFSATKQKIQNEKNYLHLSFCLEKPEWNRTKYKKQLEEVSFNSFPSKIGLNPTINKILNQTWPPNWFRN